MIFITKKSKVRFMLGNGRHKIFVKKSRAGNQEARTGLGRANSGMGQNRAGPKLARFFMAKILVAQPALKTGLVGPNSLLKSKKNSSGPGQVGPYL